MGPQAYIKCVAILLSTVSSRYSTVKGLVISSTAPSAMAFSTLARSSADEWDNSSYARPPREGHLHEKTCPRDRP